MRTERTIEKVNAERVVLLGWGAAILMQLAHPLVAAGVAEHSAAFGGFRARLRRLWRTVGVMLAVNFAAPEEVQQAAGGVNAIHRRVHGHLDEAAGAFRADAAYSAEDPALLRWVFATLMYALPRAYELFVGPLSADEKVRFCREGAAMAELFNLPARDVPPTMDELHAYLDETIARGEIAVSATARALVQDLFWSRSPLAARPLLALVRLPAIGLLPPSIRAAYGFRWDARHEAALRAMALLTRLVLPMLPSTLRYWPQARVAAAGARSGAAGRDAPAEAQESVA